MSIEDRKIPPRPGSEANYARAYRLPGGAAMTTTETPLSCPPSAAEPCQCHQSFASVTPTHPGHCCFIPATQICHPAEFAEWERQNALRHPSREGTS